MHLREDIVGVDSSIIGSPAIWCVLVKVRQSRDSTEVCFGCRQASGHAENFSDPMVDCKESKLRYRADQLFWGRVEVHLVVARQTTRVMVDTAPSL